MAAPLPDKPDHGSVASEAARSAAADVNTANPANVTGFNQSKQTASARLVQAHAYRDGPSEIGRERPPDLASAPVYFPGGQTHGMTWPVAVDDPGLAIICDRGLDEWKSTGGKQTEPQDLRRHDPSDAVFFPGVRSPASPLPATAYDPSALVIYGPAIKLGDSTATDFVALASLVQSQIAALWTAMNTHIHSGVSTGLGASGTSGLAGSAGSVASTRVKSL